MNFPLQGENRLTDPGARLRLLWEQRNIVVMPGVFNAALARLVQFHGFEACYISGAGVTNSLLGLPDHAFISLPDMVQVCHYITAVVDIPAIADADTGYGGALQTARAVQILERAGLAGVHIEDQTSPKRCGHLEGKEVVPTAEMVAKIRAAVGARSNPNFVIIARTDARAVEGLDSAIERAKRYLQAGADAIFPEALQSAEEFEQFARAIAAPLLANMTEFGKTPYLTVTEFAQMGYKMVIFPMSCFRAMMHAAEQTLLCLKQHGTQTPMLDAMQTRAELYELLEYDRYLQYDRELAQE
ncbi:MAG: methylisocitrate lyase [Fimbriimonadales bacterium]|nr:MAG: methylisocitrate lyase [Fimbriimonadales bacterium]